ALFASVGGLVLRAVLKGKGKDTDPPPVVVPGPKPAAEPDPDREAALWALSLGGKVRVDGQEREVTAPADLPPGRFALTWVSLINAKATDEGVARLAACKGLRHLDLGATAVTDDGLAHLSRLEGLEFLSLHSTAVTDRGLAHLEHLGGLVKLW